MKLYDANLNLGSALINTVYYITIIDWACHSKMLLWSMLDARIIDIV